MSALQLFVDLVRQQADAVCGAVDRDYEVLQFARQVLNSRQLSPSAGKRGDASGDVERYLHEGIVTELDIRRCEFIDRLRLGLVKTGVERPPIPSRTSRLIDAYRPKQAQAQYVTLCQMAVEESKINGTAAQVVERLEDLFACHERLFDAAIRAVINGEPKPNREVVDEHRDCVRALQIYMPPGALGHDIQEPHPTSGPSYLGLVMDLDHHVIFRTGSDQEPIDNLPPLTWKLLLMLVQARGSLREYADFCRAWTIDGVEELVEENRVYNEICKARGVAQEFGLDIENVRGSGWRLIDPTSHDSSLVRERKAKRQPPKKGRPKKRKNKG